MLVSYLNIPFRPPKKRNSITNFLICDLGVLVEGLLLTRGQLSQVNVGFGHDAGLCPRCPSSGDGNQKSGDDAPIQVQNKFGVAGEYVGE